MIMFFIYAILSFYAAIFCIAIGASLIGSFLALCAMPFVILMELASSFSDSFGDMLDRMKSTTPDDDDY